MTQDNELQTVSSYYSIVLASRVTKRNAACYAELLQNKGFKEARVLITDNNVKLYTEHTLPRAKLYCSQPFTQL